jgi:MFS family permease
VLVYALGWASIFWVNLPLIALVAAMAWQSLPARTGTRRREGFDLAGIGLLTAALSAVMLTPSLLKDGRGAVAALILVAGSVAAWAFVRHERGAVAPVVDPRLFRSRHFAAACAVVALANLVMYTTLLAVPLYLEHVEGQGARVTGLTLGAMSVLAAFSTPLGGRWADRGGRWLPAVTGSAVIVAGAALMSAGMAVGSIPVLVAGLMALGLGLGISGAPVQAASVDSVPAARAGSASGVYSTSRYVGSVVGSSALALVFANEPNAGDGDLFAWVFSALVIVAVGALVASARVADRQASHPRSHPART